MSKWIIEWDVGYGKSHDVIEADSYDEAVEVAYEYWKEEAESNADYGAQKLTEELAEDLL